MLIHIFLVEHWIKFLLLFIANKLHPNFTKSIFKNPYKRYLDDILVVFTRMNLPLQRAKKRITHIGQASAEVQSDENDFMSEILKAMDIDVEHSLLHQAPGKSLSGSNTEQVSLETSSMSAQHKVTMPKLSKKFLPGKKHPLMEKCQRNLKYLKHNRSVPKQRAHITVIPNSLKTHLANTQINKASSHGKGKRDNFVVKPNIKNRQSHTVNTEIEDIIYFENSDYEKSSSDKNSDSEFESFIREQKRTIESEDTVPRTLGIRKKHKSKKEHKKMSARSNSDFNALDQNTNSVTVPQISKRKLNERGTSDSSVTTCIANSGSFKTSKTEAKYEKSKKKLSNFNLQRAENSFQGKLDISDDSMLSTSINNSESFVTSKKKHKTKRKSKRNISCINNDNDSNAASGANGISFGEITDSDVSILENGNLNSDNEVDTIISDICPETEKIGSLTSHLISFDLTKADTMSYIAKHFSCTVRIKRDLMLDKRAIIAANKDVDPNNKVMSCESVKLTEQSNIVYNSTVPRNCDAAVVLENTSDSDDDCQFLCEIPVSRFNVTNNAFRKLNEKFPHIHVSSQNSPNDSVINNCYETSIPATSDRESKFDFKISAIHSLGNSNNSDHHSVNVLDNDINTADITRDKNHSVFSNIVRKYPDFVCNENVPVKHTLPGNSNQIVNDTKPSSNQVIVPNLDQLLGNIDFRLINKISKQPSLSDVAAIDHPGIVSAPEGKLFSRKHLPPAKITRNISSGVERGTLKFTSSLENSCASNHLNVASDPNLLKCVDTVKGDILKLPNEPNISETDKIVFKKVLLLADSEQNNPCVEASMYTKHDHLIPNYNRILPSVMPGNTDVSLPILSKDSFWQGLKDAVTINNYLSNNSCLDFVTESKTDKNFNSLVIKDNPNSNRIVVSKDETPPVYVDGFCNSNENLTISVLSKRNLPYQPETIPGGSKIVKVDSIKEEDPYERPSYELDCIAAASIRELGEPKQSVSPLFNLYSKELRQYDEIVNAEKNVSAGLKMLEEKQAKKIKYIEAAICNMVQHDPCFQKVKEEKLSLFNKNIDSDNVTDIIRVKAQKSECYAPGVAYTEDSNLKEAIQLTQGHLKQVKKEADISLKSAFQSKQDHSKQKQRCDNCEREAKFRCQNCRKAFFCSFQCGVDFWEKEHGNNCEQLKEAVS